MKKKIKIILILALCLIMILFLSPVFIISKYGNLIFVDQSSIPHHEVAIVFGAGVLKDGSPSDMLKDRLDTAADIYLEDKVDKILVSGDNRFHHYNEPEKMKLYLVNQRGIPSQDVVEDFAGRRTYDTCVRAKQLWDIDEALLITQGYHLPRALFVCNNLGINSVGFSATKQFYIMDSYNKSREILAIYKSIVDLYILEPKYILGKKETLYK